MTGDEVRTLFFDLKWLLLDEREVHLAGAVEDILIRLRTFRQPVCREYADMILPSGKSRHVRLVLSRPYEARVYAFITAILRSVE